MLVVILLEVSEKEEGVVVIHIPTGSLKNCSGLEPVQRCEPSTHDLATAPSGAGYNSVYHHIKYCLCVYV